MLGKTIAHYRIVDTLGAGAMGEVFLAEDTRLKRKVALKVLPAELAADPERLARFQREAEAIASLNHPHIVTIYSVEEAEGLRFITMEWVEGETLDQVVPAAGLDLDQLLELAVPIGDALAAAHARGIVHRDLKPANIMVAGDGRVKLLDFGLAKQLDPAPAAGDPRTLALTQGGAVLGTLLYMSPEQLQGRPVDERSDIFSLGVVLFELATGERPFAGDSPAAVVASLLSDQPAMPDGGWSELPPALEDLLRRCLEREPERRYQSVRELQEDLVSLARRTAPAPSASQPSSRENDPMRLARQALARQSWSEAFELFARADGSQELSSADLERFAEAAWWTRHMNECISARERAYAARVESGEPGPAALLALLLAEDHFHRLAPAVGNGWLKRAERLLEDQPDSVESGYLVRMATRRACEVDGDLDRGLELAERTLALASRFKDRDLQALALQDKGRVLVFAGRVAEGMALLDEAMAAAVGGELSPLASGRTFCNMLDTCEKLADYRRAGEWSEAAKDWCHDYMDSGFPGICRVHRSEVERCRGAWSEAERLARQASEELTDSMPDVAGEAHHEIGEILLRRGELERAEQAFRRGHELGREPVPGLALLRLAQGKLESARSLIEGALADTSRQPLDRARLLGAGTDILLASGRLERARSTVEEQERIAERYGSLALRAGAAYARGALQLREDRAREAISSLQAAARLAREAHLPYECARARVLLANAYRLTDSPENAELELQAARAAFEGLGAAADLRAAS